MNKKVSRVIAILLSLALVFGDGSIATMAAEVNTSVNKGITYDGSDVVENTITAEITTQNQGVSENNTPTPSSNEVVVTPDKGAMYTPGWQVVDGKTVYIKPDGSMANGLYVVDGKGYIFKDTVSDLEDIYEMQIGYVEYDERWYFAKSNGVLQTGFQKINDVWRYFATPEDAINYNKDIVAEDDKVTDYSEIAVTADGNWVTRTDTKNVYYFKNGTTLLKGSQTIDSKRYVFTKEGYVTKGFARISGKNYYFFEKASGDNRVGARAVGTFTIRDPKTAQMSDVDYAAYVAGLADNGIYAGDKGTRTYYANTSGVITSGWNKIDGNWRYFEYGKKSDYCVEKKVTKNGDFYTLGADSNTDDLQDSYKEIAKVARIYYITTAIQKGWQTLGIHKYYIKSNGIVSTGVTRTGGKYYCFDNTGKMQTYQFAYNGKTYLADKSGVLKTGWQKISDNWYYYSTKASDLTVYGSRADGMVDVDYWAYVDNGDGSDAYYLDKGTSLVTGFKTISLQNYFFDASGKLQKSGFFKDGNYTYFARPGKTKKGNSDKVGSLVKGYVKNLDTTGDGIGDGKNYYFNDKGQMQFGWQYISEITLDSEVGYNSAWHFFDTVTGEELTWTEGGTYTGGKKYIVSAVGSSQDIGTYYITTKGEVVRGGFKLIGTKIYYFDKYGKIMMGLKTINKSNYCFDQNGVLQRGLVKFDASENVLQSGDAPHHMRFYDLKTGVQRYGWQTNGTKKYYIFAKTADNAGLVATGFQEISSKIYYFYPSKIDGKGEPGEVAKSEFFTVGGKEYYASSTGALYKGYKKIGTGFYLFDDTTGELLSDKNAPAKSGWTIQDGSKYYILNGALVTGLKKIGSKTYYFNKLGEMQTGFVKTSTSSYYFDANGEMVTGLTTLGAPYNGTFYFATDGKMQTGFKRIRVADVPTTMFFDTKGVRQTIQPLALQLDGSFANDTPAVLTWVKVGNDIYYLTKQVTPAKGFKTITGKKFYFNSAGVLQTGSISISKKPYLFDDNGNPLTGWINNGGTYYYAGSTGKLATGLKKIKGADSITRSYLFDSAGALQVGKFEYNKATYISSSTGTLGQELGSLLKGYVSYDNGGTIEKYFISSTTYKMGYGWKKVDVNGIITWRFFDYVTGIENQALAGDTKGSDISTALNPITVSDNNDNTGTVKIKANDVVSLSEIVSVKAKIYNEDAGSLTAKTYQLTKVGATDDYTLDFDIANHKYAQGNYIITLIITDAKKNVRKLKSSFIMKCNYNDVALSVTPNENQSKLDLKVVNGRFSTDYKAIKVLLTAPSGSNKYYTLKNKGMGVYEGVADLKDFGYRDGTYTGKLYAQTIDQDGAMAIKVGAAYITDDAAIAGVDAGTISMISKDDTEGTFLVEVSGNNAVAPIVDAYVSVQNFVEEEGSAVIIKKFQMLKNEEGNYYANVDSGYFGYLEGSYAVKATLVDERGLQSTTDPVLCNNIKHSLADLKLTPKRNAQQSGFLFTVENARFNKNVKTVKAKVDIAAPGTAYGTNGSSLKEYTLAKTGNKTYYGNVNIKNHGYVVGDYYRVRLYVQTASGANAKMKDAGGVTEAADENLVYVKTAYFKVDANGTVTEHKDAGKEGSFVWIDGVDVSELYGKVVAIDKDKGRNTVVVGGTILTPADVSKVEMIAYPKTVNYTSNLAHTYAMTRQKDGTYKAVIDILNHELTLGDYKVQVKVTDTRGVVTKYNAAGNLDGNSNEFLITKLTASAEYLAGLATTKGVGIDVSKHQGAINWAQVATNENTNTAGYKHKIRFAMIRSSYTGRDTLKLVTDEKYATNVAGAKAAGIKTGVYHYSCAADVNKAKEEANYSIAVVNKAGGGIALPIAFDIEEATRRSVNSKQSNTDMVIAFAQQVKAAGYKPMVYADKDMFVNYLDEDRIRAAGIDFWVAQWNKTGQTAVKDCQIWQTTDKGTVSGISGSVDMNVCYKEYK